MTRSVSDYDRLLDWIGDAPIVLLGEATHGTHEFYRERAAITSRLITENGFNAVAVEADWPDAYRVNRFVRGRGADRHAIDALGDFKRFPRWMWRNEDVLQLVAWLRVHNDQLDPSRRVGFYGLDLYSLNSSMSAVIEYLEKTDREAARRARQRYGCFEDLGADPQSYGLIASIDVSESCEQAVVAQLVELQRTAYEYTSRDGLVAEDELFCAEQNARVARNAEQYYREMYRGDVSSWNMRDRHMADTLDELLAFLARRALPKVVVWEHNSHVGDARATAFSDREELNVGQLVRERHGRDAFLVGFTTFEGTVAAASDWDGPVQCKRVWPARPDSFEGVFHGCGLPAFMLHTAEAADRAGLIEPRLERAIGVIYRPESELASHYFRARIDQQFDAVVHLDRTRSVTPLDISAGWGEGEAAETYPTGL